MKYKNYEMEDYNLHILKTKNFKQIKIYVDLITEEKQNFTYNIPLLASILSRTNSKYETIGDKYLASYELYAPSYKIGYQSSGSLQIFGLALTFLNEKYTEKGMNEKTIEFAFNILFNPKIKNGSFDEEILEVIKKEDIHGMETIKEQRRSYISRKLFENMPVTRFPKLSLTETIEKEKEVTGKSLYKFYKNFLKNSRLEIFVTGDIDENQIKDIIQKQITYKPVLNKLPSPYITQTKVEPLKIIKEQISDKQSMLAIGLVAQNLSFFESNYVLRMYSSILGGDSSSLLNKEAREEKSLCYSITTGRDDFTGIIRISSAFDKNNYDEIMSVVKNKMEDMKNGNFSDTYIDDFKRSYITSFDDTEDFIATCTNDMEGEIIYGDDSNKDKIKKIKKVTKEDVMNLAKKVYMRAIVFLEGEGQND